MLMLCVGIAFSAGKAEAGIICSVLVLRHVLDPPQAASSLLEA